MGRRQHKREPARVQLYTEAAADGHRHVAVFNRNGDGWTTTANGHHHLVRELEVQAEGGHTHELSTERAKLDELDEVPGAVA